MKLDSYPAGDLDAMRGHLAAGLLNSDHAPLSCDVPGLGSVVTYNIMTQMRAEGDRVNNGFGATESTEEYESRVRRIAAELGDFSRQGAVVVVLQEAPTGPRLAAALTEKLPHTWRALWMPTRGERFAQVILYSASELHGVQQAAPDTLGPQTGRVQLVALARGDSPPVTLANVHLVWGQSCDAAIRALERVPGYVVVAGDFNRPLASVDLPRARRVFPERPTSIKYTASGPEMNSIDGFLLRP